MHWLCRHDGHLLFWGPISGMIVGSLGVILYFQLTDKLRGMPGLAIGNLVIRCVVGLVCTSARHIQNRWRRYAILICAIVVSTVPAILWVKSIVEVILYALPMLLRVAKNIYAVVADAAVMAFSIPLCEGMKGIKHKLCSEEIIQ